MGKENEKRFCPHCGIEKPINFFIIDFRQKNEFLPLCRSCTDKIVNSAIEKYNTMSAGVWHGAMVNNVPMIKDVWEKSLNIIIESDAKSPFAIYYRTLRDIQGTYTDVTESDCWLGDFVKLNEEEEIEESIEDKPIFTKEELLQLFKEWGKFVDRNGVVDEEAYLFLSQRYTEYTDGLVDLTLPMATQYRNLCKAEWQKIKADESGDINEIGKAQKLIDNLLSALKLDDFAVNKSDTDRFIDRLIWRIEETEPAEEEDEKLYVDIAGYEAMYNSMLRSLKNMIANTREYPDVPIEEV